VFSLTLTLSLHNKQTLKKREGKHRPEEREKEMEVTTHDSVDSHEWSTEEVVTFVRSLGTSECFQSPGDQVLQLGVDDSVHVIPRVTV
jgi:hypothetical protein